MALELCSPSLLRRSGEQISWALGPQYRPYNIYSIWHFFHFTDQSFKEVYISNIPPEGKEETLRDIFQRYGEIARIFVGKDKITGQCKGFGFITFETKEGAKLAVEADEGTISKNNSDHHPILNTFLETAPTLQFWPIKLKPVC